MLARPQIRADGLDPGKKFLGAETGKRQKCRLLRPGIRDDCCGLRKLQTEVRCDQSTIASSPNRELFLFGLRSPTGGPNQVRLELDRIALRESADDLSRQM